MADLPTSFHLTVVTRERKIVETDAVETVLPASDGEIGVLPGHTPMLASLRVGIVRYRAAEGGTLQSLVISWGFAEILPERVIVMAETARLPQEMDITTAEAERAKLERELADLSSHDPQFANVEARLEESVAMISVHRGM
ncbi:MAG TPA: ATP synthase F1 subunit epsilon [Thermoanaerobaculia bacterium]|nr:ATP synthase F1 subunit epsilon [Thermoanaerobaculia bacterium]